MKTKFSALGKKVDFIVQKHMDIIVDEVKNELSDVVSILVIGGLGRGEGSFLFRKGKVVPLNDYDIYIITQKPVNFNILKKISKKSSKRISANSQFSFSESSSLMEFYVDFRNMTFKELKKIEPLIKYFEIRESAKIIFGRNIKKDMPNFSLLDIPLEEGFRFLMNRMSLLVESFDIFNLNSFDVRKTILYYIGKNYLSCAEALLLLNRKFVASYERRAKIFEECFKRDFPELYKQIPNLSKKINLFTANKLKPSKDFFEKDVLKFWIEARKDLLHVTNFFIKKAFGLKASNPEELSLKIKKLNKNFINNYLKIFLKSKFNIKIPFFLLDFLGFFARFYFNFLYFKRNLLLNQKKNFRVLFSNKDINLRIYSICPLILFSLNDNMDLEAKYLKKARKRLNEFEPLKKIVTWKDLQKKYSDIFRVYQFLKF